MSSVVNELSKQINDGKIIFDSPVSTTERLKKELLGENTGTKVTSTLQALVLELSKLTNTHIRISSLVRNQGHHGAGRAVDLGNENIAAHLLPKVATDDKVGALKIDELIFDAAQAGQQSRNEWNYDQGKKHTYDTSTLDSHKDHIHVSVKQ